jgi:hypothetical protein
MKQKKPDMPVFSVANCGHAPLLNDKAQIDAIRDFLGKVAL